MGATDFFKKLGSEVASIAPTIAGALGGAVAGPVGASLATTGAKAISGALGVKTTDPAELSAALASATPEQLQSLQKADADLKKQLRELDIQELELYEKDRESARDRESKTGDSMPAWIAGASLTGFFGLLTIVAFHDPPGNSEEILQVMIGALGALVVQVGNYYFGASKGSSVG